MNLIDGKIMNDVESYGVVDDLSNRIVKTLERKRFSISDVICACDKLSNFLNTKDHLYLLKNLGISDDKGKEYIEEAKIMLSKKYLEHKVFIELGANALETYLVSPPFINTTYSEKRVPLGVLFHIAAGNMEGLPVFTVIEGLLSGNINILKLPSEEGGLSVLILQKLIEYEARLAEYIYVFDYSSKDTVNLDKLANIADGVVVWGGDAVIKAIRNRVTPSTKIIEWGHKVSFAYAIVDIEEKELLKLAKSICSSNQLLCSSCQGIYVDTDKWENLLLFAQRFLEILDEESIKTYDQLSISIQALTGLKIYNEELESKKSGAIILRGKGANVIIYPDQKLSVSIMYRNIWIKPLPRREIIQVLKPYKGYLQTVALLCREEDKNELIERFIAAGVERITSGENMSTQYCGEAHDGDYPLRKYTKLVILK